MRNFVINHPTACFLALTFAWSWGWWIPILGMDMSDLAAVGPFFYIGAMIGGFGPTIAGLILRFSMPRGERPRLLGKPRPYLFLLAAAFDPAVTLATQSVLGLAGLPSDMVDIASRLVIGLVWPLMASAGEEFGWRGFLFPLWGKGSAFWKPTIAVGLLWGLWYLPTDWIGLREMGLWFIPQYILVGPLNLTALSVIMSAIIRRGGGDIRLALVFHYAVTAGAILFGAQGKYPPAATIAASAVSLGRLACAGCALVLLLKPWDRTEEAV